MHVFSLDSHIPPPIESSTSATSALQRELKMMLREQRAAKSLRELGWYMPEDLMGDNLYQWIVELHTFDKDIPVAKDMEAQYVYKMSACYIFIHHLICRLSGA